MKELRSRILVLLVWLFFFLNIGQFQNGTNEPLAIPLAVTFVGLIAVVLPHLPIIRRWPFVLLIIMVGALDVGASLVSPVPAFGGVYTYLSVAGFFMVMLTLILSYRVAQAIEEFQQAVETVTFSDDSRLRNLNEAQDIVELEMISSRREHRPLSLVMLQADPSSLKMVMHRLVQEVQRSMMQRYVLSSAARVLATYLRRTDIVIEGGKAGRLLFVVPETSEENATRLGERLTRLSQEKLGINAVFSTATFPDHALTFERLRDIAEQRLRDEQPVVDYIASPERETATKLEQQAQEQLVPKEQPQHIHAAD